MKTRTKTIASAALCAAVALSAGAAVCSARQPEMAAAETEAELSLFLPDSYEQYLPLNNPKDAAMNERYVAVADDATLYYYARETGVYAEYHHVNLNGVTSGISTLHFAADESLFFSDEDARLYRFDLQTGEARVEESVTCSTFLIENNTFYTATSTGPSNFTVKLSAYAYQNGALTFLSDIDSFNSTVAPCLTYSGGTLYCTQNDYTVLAYTATSGTYPRDTFLLAGSQAIVTNLTAFCALNGEFYYTVSGTAETLSADGLYRATINVSSERLIEGSGFSGLFTYGGSLYCIKDGKIRELRLSETSAEYTGYEIATDSDLFNREANAGETVRGGTLLVTADRGNSRVLVYDMQTRSYSSVWLNAAPSCVATDGAFIAVGIGNTVRVYRNGESEPVAVKTVTNGTVVTGVACLFGTVYYVTDHSYGTLTEGVPEVIRSGSPAALTNDVWGNLYVADAQGKIAAFTEEEFLSPSANGVTKNWTLPAVYKSLRSDFDGNLYYLSGNTLYRNGASLATANGGDLVYRGENPAPLSPVSFALGFEDGTVYFQYGSFMAKAELSFPTLSSIAADGTYERVFSVSAPSDLKLVTVRKNATSVRVDLGKLTAESEYFAYTEYVRAAGGSGIVLAETDKYSVVALYGNYGYTLGLYLTADCAEVPAAVKECGGETRYLSNEISLSYYPCLAQPLTRETLSRKTKVTLLAEVGTGEGFDFAYVGYEGENGTLYGYVPQGYLLRAVPVSDDAAPYTLGYLKANKNGVVFTADDGGQITVTERTQVKIYAAENGGYLAQFTAENGVVYAAEVAGEALEKGNSDVMRTSLIIVLCILAVGIITAYCIFVPGRKKK